MPSWRIAVSESRRSDTAQKQAQAAPSGGARNACFWLSPDVHSRAMATLLTILDVVVLVLLIALLLRVVGGFGSGALSLFVGLFVILLALISLGAYTGLVGASSGSTQAIFLVILLAMASAIASSWKHNTRPS